MKINSRELMLNALRAGTVIPAFNMPHLPVMAPVVQALREANAFGFIAVARLEWIKFEAKSLKAVRDQYESVKDERFTRLHLDHLPVIDEDQLKVDYLGEIGEALELGYDSVMVDASRLDLDGNIKATRSVVEKAKTYDTPVEAELGAVLGHEKGPLPPYEELFASGRGFTDVDQAKRFVAESGVDWLSVSVGTIHGAISGAARHEKKPEAKINLEHLEKIHDAVGIPLVLHGGTGVKKHYVLDAVTRGIAKINIASVVRQAYESKMEESIGKAQENVYKVTLQLLRDVLEIENSAGIVNPER